jgi:hypothetical protein
MAPIRDGGWTWPYWHDEIGETFGRFIPRQPDRGDSRAEGGARQEHPHRRQQSARARDDRQLQVAEGDAIVAAPRGISISEEPLSA